MTEEGRQGLRAVEKKKKLVKSKQRVADHGEVFTPDWLVEDMLELVVEQTFRIDSRFLEPACGDGNFLVPILIRKLRRAKKQFGRNKNQFTYNALMALWTLYGIDIMEDNVLACRERLALIWFAVYEVVTDSHVEQALRDVVTYVLERNIVLGNALSMKKVNDKAMDIDEPIILPEWSWMCIKLSGFGGGKVKRNDYRFDHMVQLGEEAAVEDDLFAAASPPPRPRAEVVRSFPPIHYLSIPSLVEEEVPL